MTELRSKNLFKRCVECDSVVTATCPTCKTGEICVLTAQSCQTCPVYQCQSISNSPAVESNPQATAAATAHKSPAPQIAGGIVGGILVISIITYVIWKFVLKGKRRESVMDWDQADYQMEKPGSLAPPGSLGDARSRASTHTVTSMASTVLTRASNVIQIAYIPGVQNRQSQGTSAHSPNSIIPPMPPIPIPTNGTNSMASSRDDNIMFMPGDLRDSTFTDMSELDLPTRKSMAPSLARSSIGSAIIKDEAASAVKLHVKPSMVNVSSKSPTTPPVPSVDLGRFNSQNNKGPKVMIPASIENNARGGGPLKPKTVTIVKKGGVGKSKLGPGNSSSSSSTPVLGSESSGTPDLNRGRMISIAESQTTLESNHARAKHLSDDEESDDEASHERARQSMPDAASALTAEEKGKATKRDQSPFSDDAEIIDSPTLKGETQFMSISPFGDDKAIR
jgi:hypothetical protein